MEYNPLIYGKNNTERIVSIEAHEDEVEIFIQDEAGVITSKIEDNVYWLLSNVDAGNSWIKLEGNLHYKYAKTFRDRKDFFKYKQYLRSRQVDFYAVNDAKEAIMVRNGYTYFKGLVPKDLSLLSFDIETTGLTHDDESKILLISNTFRFPLGNGLFGERKKLFSYDNYSSPVEMLKDWCLWVREQNPSILLGHNIITFDLPYMQYIAEKEGVTLDLGRNKSSLVFDKYESKFRKDGSQFYHYHKIHCYGRDIIDTLFLSIKHDATERKFESYGLKQIIKQLDFEKKDRVFYDASKIRENYTIPEEWEKIKRYCVDDSDDPIALFDYMAPALFYATQSIPRSFQSVVESATGSQINSILVRAYLQDKHSIPKGDEKEAYPGGISMGNPGIYKNVWKVDVASLYPSIIIEYKIEDRAKDPKGYFQQMVITFTAERLKNKKLFMETADPYYDGLQAAQKIFINSAYGFLGAPRLNFNATNKAALVTEYGREILNKSIDWAKFKGFQIVNADTDSISIAREDQEFIPDEFRKSYLIDLNSNFPEKIRFADDGYYETVIILKAKNYVLKKKGEKPKFKGAAIKATTKEKRLQQLIKDFIKELGLGRNNFLSVYNSYAKEIMTLTDITEWCTKKTVTDKVLNGTRSNETKVNDVIEDTDYREGDKIYVYFKSDKTLGLRENFDGDYSVDALLKKLYDTAKVFQNVIDVTIFPNYSLKKNKKLLQELLDGKQS